MSSTRLSAKARILIRKSPAAVFDAFANAEKMSKFWFTRHDEGLKEGEAVAWSLGTGADAMSFDVHVTEVREPEMLVIEWVGYDGKATQVTWSFEETDGGDTILTVEETGFTGSDDEIVKRVIDSTGGFNQVVIAAKALIEHGIELNVVADHA